MVSFLLNNIFYHIPPFHFTANFYENKKLIHQKLNKLKSIKTNISSNKNIWTLKLSLTFNLKLQLFIDPIFPNLESAHLLKKNAFQQTKSKKKALSMKVETLIKQKKITPLKNLKFHTNNSKKSLSTEGIKGKDPLTFKIQLLVLCRL